MLETRVIIKIVAHPGYPINVEWFSWEWRKKIEKKIKMAESKNLRFSKPGLVLGLVELIDKKGIDVDQPIWLRDYPI